MLVAKVRRQVEPEVIDPDQRRQVKIDLDPAVIDLAGVCEIGIDPSRRRGLQRDGLVFRPLRLRVPWRGDGR